MRKGKVICQMFRDEITEMGRTEKDGFTVTKHLADEEGNPVKNREGCRIQKGVKRRQAYKPIRIRPTR